MAHPKLAGITARTVDGRHQVVIVDTDGTEHVFDTAVDGMCLIRMLDEASAPIQLSEQENAGIAAEVFERILTDIEKWTIHDADGTAVDHSLIHKIVINVTEYDNGYFPSGSLEYFTADGHELHPIEDEHNEYGIVAVVDDGDLNSELAELGGPFRHNYGWELALTRPN